MTFPGFRTGAVDWIKVNCSEPRIVYAPIRSMRQQMQRGRFMLFANRIETNELDIEDIFGVKIKQMQDDKYSYQY